MKNERKVMDVDFGKIRQSARDVSNAMLSRTGAAMMSGRMDEFIACFTLPTTVETFDGKNIVKTVAEFETVFIGMHKHLVRNSVTEMIRHCVSAEFDGPDVVKATHETRLMNGTHLVQEPYPCYSVLRRVDANWKIESCSYAIVNAPHHSEALMGRMHAERLTFKRVGAVH